MGHPSSTELGCSDCIPLLRKGKEAVTGKVLGVYFSSVKCNVSGILLLKGVVVYVREINYPTRAKVIVFPEILDIFNGFSLVVCLSSMREVLVSGGKSFPFASCIRN